jgi:hypothetical protein
MEVVHVWGMKKSQLLATVILLSHVRDTIRLKSVFIVNLG